MDEHGIGEDLPDLESMRMFATVVSLGSISHAAEKLYLSKSVVKRRIDALEAWAGTPLLTRGARGVEPTSAGVLFLSRTQSILADMQLLRSSLAQMSPELAGRVVRVAFFSDFLFPSPQHYSDYFSAAHPNAKVVPVTVRIGEVLQALKDGLVDVTLCVPPSPQEAVGLSITALSMTEMYGIVNAADPSFKDVRVLSTRDCATHKVATHVGLCSREDVAAWEASLDEPVSVQFVDGGMEAAQQVCLQGGIFLFPKSDVGLFPYPFAALPLARPLFNRNTIATSSSPTPVASEFVSCAVEFTGQVSDPSGHELEADWTRLSDGRA